MKRKSLITKYILLLILLVFFMFLSIALGTVNITFGDLVDALINRNTSSFYGDVIFQIRLPRAIAAALTGGALALSGYSLQTFFRNPIAGPYILGISSGAKLMVAVAFIIGGGSVIGGNYGMILASFIGALITVIFVLLCSRRISNMALLLVCGVMIGYICTAATDFMVTFASDADIVNLHNWSKGSLSGMTFESLKTMATVIIVASIFMFLVSKPMMAYLMGESYARSVGVNIKVFRGILILLSSILAATVTAFVGPVSFVGIAVPHLARGFMKETKPIVMIPACFLGGGVFTLFCDLIARMVLSPTELSISTVTAVFGAPVVVYLLLRNKMGK